MKAYIFLGPSLPLEEAKTTCEAEFLPPVALGDITRLLPYRPKVIGIIDGYFDSVPAVWHKEILLALAQGIHVVGGSSMGALRAAELYPFGMEGVGEIFEWYRDGVIEADDEVAVVHTTTDFEYRPFSEPMVNIRKTLAQAASDGIIDQAVHHQLIEITRQTFYKERSYPKLLADGRGAGLPPEAIAALEAYLPENRINLKRQDSIKVLQRVEELRSTAESPAVDYQVAHTTFVSELLDKHQTVVSHEGHSLDILDLTSHARIEWSDFKNFRERAFTNLLMLQYAVQNDITLSPDEIEYGKQDFLDHLGINAEEIDDWAERNHIPSDQFEQHMLDWLLIHKVKSQASSVDNRTLLWQARLENRFEELLEDVKVMQTAAFEADGQLDEESLGENVLFEYFREIMGVAPDADVMDYASELGFSNKSVLYLALLKSYLAQQHKKNQKN